MPQGRRPCRGPPARTGHRGLDRLAQAASVVVIIIIIVVVVVLIFDDQALS
jgi:hypothetical protein